MQFVCLFVCWNKTRKTIHRLLFFFWFGIHTTSVPSTAETHTGRGAVLGKPGGSPARRHSRNIGMKQTFVYADIQTNEKYNTTHIRNSNLILDCYISLLMLTMWITVVNYFDFCHVSIWIPCMQTYIFHWEGLSIYLIMDLMYASCVGREVNPVERSRSHTFLSFLGFEDLT